MVMPVQVSSIITEVAATAAVGEALGEQPPAAALADSCALRQ